MEETSMRSVRVLGAQEMDSEYIDHLKKHVYQRWFLVSDRELQCVLCRACFKQCYNLFWP